jgi:DNA-binding transcriptional LysR family regulator
MAEWVAPLAARFLARHPDVRVELVARSEAVELLGRGADLAVTHGPQADSSQATRLLGTLPTGLYAARTWLARHGPPARPEALSDQPTLFFAASPLAPREWRLGRGRRVVTVPLTPRLTANDLRPLLAGLRTGTGVLLAPRLSVEGLLAAGEVAPVLPEWSPSPLELRVVFPSRRALPPRVRLFVDLLAERAAPLVARAGAPPAPPGSPA